MPKGTPHPNPYCSIEGCGKPHYARGWCCAHWTRWWRHGTTDDPRQQRLPCLVDGCESLREGHGYCVRHYTQWRKHGDPLVKQRAGNGEPLAWLISELAARSYSDECWEWPYAKVTSGYGELTFEGKPMYAAVCALILSGSPKPEPPNNFALHSCDNPPCFNPTHLRWGSHQDNVDDMWERERGHRGGKLTEDQVRAIRSDARFQKVIAEEYGLAQSTVSQIQMRKRWKHVL